MGEDKGLIKIGLLHSLTGVMAISEKNLLLAELLAIEEINNSGGIMGRTIEPVIVDGCSDPAIFKAEAEQLLSENINILFGCWTSSSRKAVRDVVEKADGVLWYPIQYEGLEESKNIIYTGSCTNQQVLPAIAWACENLGKKAVLIGTDYIFPRTANLLIRNQIEKTNGEILQEVYVDFSEKNFHKIVKEIKKMQPDVVFSTLNGEGNIHFYKEYQKQGITAQDIPIMNFSLAETECKHIQYMEGHLACWGYFQSIESAGNKEFIDKFQKKHGSEMVTSDPIVTAYTQIYLFKKAAEIARSFETSKILKAIAFVKLDCLLGTIEVQQNHHITRHAYIGKVKEAGRFELLWKSDQMITPRPWLGIEEYAVDNIDFIKKAMASYPALIEQNIQLRKVIVERDSANQQLRKSEEKLQNERSKAEKANAAKSEFLANMSHEIRTPLNGIFGFTDILCEAETDETKKEYLRIIKTSSEYLLGVINEILSLSKIESGKYVKTEEVVNMCEFAYSISEAFKKQCENKKLKFLFDCDEALITEIVVDKQAVHKIINNLVGNAIKFTECGYVSLQLKLVEANITKIEIIVKDTGVGLNEQKQKKMYEAFEQGEHYLNKRQDGTGLGLSIVKKLVDLLGGNINVVTEEHVGTEFSIVLPVVSAEMFNIERNEQVKSSADDLRLKKDSKEEKKLNIISAEDKETNQRILEHILKNENWDLVKVYNGKELLEELEKKRFDVILMDVQMPIMNGLEATKIIRKNKQYDDIPIIGVSAYALEEDVVKALDAGMDDYASKPFKKQELLNKIINCTK